MDNSFASTTITRDGMARDCKATDGMVQDRKGTEKCSENMFRSVTDLSSGGEKLSGLETVDLVIIADTILWYLYLESLL